MSITQSNTSKSLLILSLKNIGLSNSMKNIVQTLFHKVLPLHKSLPIPLLGFLLHHITCGSLQMHIPTMIVRRNVQRILKKGRAPKTTIEYTNQIQHKAWTDLLQGHLLLINYLVITNPQSLIDDGERHNAVDKRLAFGMHIW